MVLHQNVQLDGGPEFVLDTTSLKIMYLRVLGLLLMIAISNHNLNPDNITLQQRTLFYEQGTTLWPLMSRMGDVGVVVVTEMKLSPQCSSGNLEKQRKISNEETR